MMLVINGQKGPSEDGVRFMDVNSAQILISADEHAQRSESPDTATATPRPVRGQAPQKQHAGLLELDAQPSAGTASICHPTEHSAEGLCLGAASSHPGHLRGIGSRISNLEAS
jgi:hypothetical protein